MIHEPTSQRVPSSPQENDDPTETSIPALCLTLRPAERVLEVRHNGAFTISIDEQSVVKLFVSDQGALVLRPEEAFELLDFLFEYRNILAARSAEIAERQGEMQKQ